MPIAICSGNYDIKTTEQATVYICMALLYFLLLLFVLHKTFLILKHSETVSLSLTALLVCINVVFVRSILYFLGGSVFCYPQSFYRIVSAYFFVFKHAVPYIMVHMLIGFLVHRQVLAASCVWLDRGVLALLATVVAAYVVMHAVRTASIVGLVVLLAYNVLSDIIILVVISYLSCKMRRYASVSKSFIEWREGMNSLHVIIVAIYSYFIFREIHLALELTNPKIFETNLSHTIQFSIYMAIYTIFTEIVPSITILVALTDKSEDVNGADQSDRSSDY